METGPHECPEFVAAEVLQGAENIRGLLDGEESGSFIEGHEEFPGPPEIQVEESRLQRAVVDAVVGEQQAAGSPGAVV